MLIGKHPEKYDVELNQNLIRKNPKNEKYENIIQLCLKQVIYIFFFSYLKIFF